MPIIELKIKPDNMFLTLTLYEGLLSLIRNDQRITNFNTDHVEITPDTYRRVFSNIGKNNILLNRAQNLRIDFVGNDLRYKINYKLLKNIGIQPSSEAINNYGELVLSVINNTSSLIDASDDELSYIIKGNTLIVGKSGLKTATAPQLLKIDRYTGFTSLDTDLTLKQIGLKITPNMIILSILGLLSSHISRVEDNTYYFLFYAPDEITGILSTRDRVFLENMLDFKDKVVDELHKLIRSRIPYELILLRIIIDLGLSRTVSELELDHVSLLLYTVKREGQTYKIYGVLPITIYGHPQYIEFLKSSIRDYEGFVDSVTSLFEPGNPLLNAVYSLNRKTPYAEAGHVL